MKRFFLTVLELIFIAVFLFSGWKIYVWFKENSRSSDIMGEISQSVEVYEEDKFKIDFEELRKKNPDTVGYLKVEGTSIEYPVVKSGDNSFYLNHSFDKSENSAGWIFMDYRNFASSSDKNMIIYGHNRKDGSMFGTLKNILNSDWQNDDKNRFIIYINEKGNFKYEVFSVYQIENESYYLKTDFKGDEFSEFADKLKSRSAKDYNVEISKSDQIITLSTCAGNDKYRVVLHAVSRGQT